MKFNYIVFLIFILFLFKVESASSQEHYFNVSIQGTWDKKKLPSRAQFGGDNKLINTYFGSFSRELLRGGSDIEGKIGELSFRITETGQIDSLTVSSPIGQMYDVVILDIILAMNGKWRAGKVNDVKQAESVTMWYYVYKGRLKRRTLQQCIEKAKAAVAENKFNDALTLADNALVYDAINVDAIIIKAQAHAFFHEKEKACKLIQDSIKFNQEKLEEYLGKYCE